MKAFVFPGQGAQYSGMGKSLYDNFSIARQLFERANEILGFEITKVMFQGSDQELKETKVTQPAIFLHSVILAKTLNEFNPQMVAGHSLGEFSALAAAGAISFEDGLQLVATRAMAMQRACEAKPSTMAAVIGLDDSTIEEVCRSVDGVVIPANYNSAAQVVISGENKAVEEACRLLKEAGAKRAIPLMVGGAFHSPLMEPAKQELERAILATNIVAPIAPIYQNVDAKRTDNPATIKENLIKQLTSPVRWRQSVENMWNDGARHFTELGPGTTLQGLIKKIKPESETTGMG
ncbi:MAG: ACP S-malonyltransferase [Bacteroidales bacterium]